MTGILSTLSTAAQKRVAYRRMVNELNALTDRELADIGVSRHNTRQIAIDAIYGK